MSLRWADERPVEAGGAWTALRLEVVESALRRPGLHVQAGPGRRMRVVSAGRTALWARVQGWGRGVAYVRGAPPAPALPPLRASEGAASLPAWARVFARGLAESAAGPLHAGVWKLAPFPRADDLDAALDAPARGFESWWVNGSGAVLPLRAPSAPDAARVKALRKRARDGVLPPALLWFVTALDLFLVIDGHDRLLAARLEGVAPTALALSGVRTMRWAADERAQAAVLRNAEKAGPLLPGTPALAKMNAALVRAFASPECEVSRTVGWPLAGGVAGWDAEVGEALPT